MGKPKKPDSAAEILAFNMALQLIVYRAGVIARSGDAADQCAAEQKAVDEFVADLRKDTWREGFKARARAAAVVEREAAAIWARRAARGEAVPTAAAGSVV